MEVKEDGQGHTVAELGFEPSLLTLKPLFLSNWRHVLTKLGQVPMTLPYLSVTHRGARAALVP